MNNKKTIGIIFILVGISLFIISFAFVKGYDKRDGFLGSLGQMEIVLKEGSDPTTPGFHPIDERNSHIAVPYKYFFAVDIALIFVGIGFLILPKRRSMK
jgi:hypothetical protein